MPTRGCRDRGERAITVVQDITRLMVAREGVPNLLGGPRRGWPVAHRDVQNPSPVVSENDEHEQESEGDCRYDEEVGRHDLVSVVREEGAPPV